MRTVSPGRCGGRGGPDPRPPGAVRARWPRVLSRRQLPASSPTTRPPALAPPQLSLARLWPVCVCGGREASSGPFGVPDPREPASLALLTLRPSRRRSHRRPWGRGGASRPFVLCAPRGAGSAVVPLVVMVSTHLGAASHVPGGHSRTPFSSSWTGLGRRPGRLQEAGRGAARRGPVCVSRLVPGSWYLSHTPRWEKCADTLPSRRCFEC